LRWEIKNGDALEMLKAMSDKSFDAVLCDPPYGISFMGKSWDHGVPSAEVWSEVLRVVKPGSMLLAFGGTRTFHRLTCAIEDAGFEIRDCAMWLYGSGFPKSNNWEKLGRFAGYGTALKPAWEPCIVAMRPLDGTIADNAVKHGVAGQGSRIPSGPDHATKCASVVGLDSNRHGTTYGEWTGARTDSYDAAGRWPANLILDPESAAALDQQAGKVSGGDKRGECDGRRDGGFAQPGEASGDGKPNARVYSDVSGPSRFFYCAKASRKERDAGLGEFRDRIADPYAEHRARRMADKSERFDGEASRVGKNHHPCLKPLEPISRRHDPAA
jgi:hypothetical protein